MKKQLLLLVTFLSVGMNYSYSQCIPDLSLTIPGIYPDSLINLDTGMVGVQYSDTIQFKVFSTVQTVTVDSIRILNITGLPSGINTYSTPPGNVFNGGSNGCVLIDGVPTTAGTYPLIVNLRVFGHVSIVPIQIDTTDDDYRIIVQPPNGIPSYNAQGFDVYQNAPNPFDSYTEISFTSPSAGKVQFKVFDLLGKEIINRNIDAVGGLNRTYLSARYLKPGIYFYSLSNRTKTITRKMIVTNKP